MIEVSKWDNSNNLNHEFETRKFQNYVKVIIGMFCLGIDDATQIKLYYFLKVVSADSIPQERNE